MSSSKKPRNGRLAVCHFYSTPRGCAKADKCNFLHICRAFCNNKGCPASSHCRYNHNFASVQMTKILQRHNLDPSNSQHISYLRNLLKPKVKKESEREEVEEDDSEDGVEEDDDQEDRVSNVSSTGSSKNNARNRRRRRKRAQNQVTPRETVGNGATASALAVNKTPEPTSDETLPRELCIYYVKNGHCQNGKECPQLHVSRLPFLWQVQRNSSWGNLDQKNSKSIEAAYCDVRVDETTIILGGLTQTVDFDFMRIRQNNDSSLKIRRLSTMASVKNRNRNMDSVCTHWVWYKEFAYGRWQVPSDDPNATISEILEKVYQCFLEGGLPATMYGFFESSDNQLITYTLTIAGDEQNEFIRRPKPYVAEPPKSGTSEESGAVAKADGAEASTKVDRVLIPASEPRHTAVPSEVAIPMKVSTRVASSTSPVASTEDSAKPKKNFEANGICVNMLRAKTCKNGEQCYRLHSDCPYQWQHVQCYSDEWTNFPKDDNKRLEESFCKPCTAVLDYQYGDDDLRDLITFRTSIDDLTISKFCIGDGQIRRISTMSTVQCRSAWLEPFCIEWMWYWQDEHGKWIQYAQKSDKNTQSDVDGDTLEMAYEDYLTGHGDNMYAFTTHENNYQLNFDTMRQQNVHYKTQRAVRRRPKFLTVSDRWQLVREQKSQDRTRGNFPKTWVMRGMKESSHEPKMILLTTDQEEYQSIKKMFRETMDGANIIAIKRVQNMELWEDFHRKRERMKKKSKNVLEKQLWHGTKRNSSEAICQQNFDFRISGSNVGTLYGQGSYFHRDASYCNSYTALESNVRRMFLVRVLVGSYTDGTSKMKRPPPKEPSNPLDLHDSCVDDDTDPAIFVIFESSQAYPEYLIEYNRSSEGGVTATSLVAARATPRATPRAAPRAAPGAVSNPSLLSSTSSASSSSHTRSMLHSSSAISRSPSAAQPVAYSSPSSSSYSSNYNNTGARKKTTSPTGYQTSTASRHNSSSYNSSRASIASTTSSTRPTSYVGSPRTHGATAYDKYDDAYYSDMLVSQMIAELSKPKPKDNSSKCVLQ